MEARSLLKDIGAEMSEQGTKYDQGKLRLELVPVEAVEAIARAMTYGANKYGDWNWSKGIDHMRLVGAALRHLTAYVRGEDIDKESGNPHLAHCLASLAMLVAQIESGKGKDDRPTYNRKGELDISQAEMVNNSFQSVTESTSHEGFYTCKADGNLHPVYNEKCNCYPCRLYSQRGWK